MANLTSLFNLPIEVWEERLIDYGYRKFSHDSVSVVYMKGEFGEIFNSIARYLNREMMKVYWYNAIDEEMMNHYIIPELPVQVFSQHDGMKIYSVNFQGNDFKVALNDHEYSGTTHVRSYQKDIPILEREYVQIIEEIQIFSQRYFEQEYHR